VATINLDVKEFLIPCEGIYATKTVVNGEMMDSVTFIGHRYSTDRAFSIETHILEHEIELKSDEVRVLFFEKLRDNRLYEDLNELKKQIEEDIKNAKGVLKSVDR